MRKYLPLLFLIFFLASPAWAAKVWDTPLRSDLTDDVGAVAGAVSRTSSGDYIDKDGVLQTATTNTARIGYNGALVDGPATNIVLQNRAFETTWTKPAGGTLTQNQTGIDGVANTAWTFNDSGGVDISYITQSIVVANNTDVYTFSIYVKKTIGATTFPGVGIKWDDGNIKAYVTVNTNTGVLTNSDEGGPDSSMCVSVNNTWWRVSVTDANPNDTGIRARFWAAVNADASGTWVAATTGSAYFDYAQVEVSVFPTSPIPTTTAPVARTTEVADAADVGYSWVKPAGLDAILSGGAGSVVFKWTPGYGETQGTGTVSILSWDDSTSSGIYTTHTDDLKITDGTNTASVALTWTANHSYVVGAYWDDSGATKLNIGYFDAGAWTWGAEQSYDGAFAITDDKLKLGYGYAFPFSIQGIRFYDTVLSDGPLVNITDNNTTIQNTLINCEDYWECVTVANGVTGTVFQNVTIVNSNGPGINGLADILAENNEFFENETDLQVTSGDTVTGNNNSLQDWHVNGAGTYTDTSTIFSNYDAVADREAGNFRLIRGNAAINAGKDLSGTFTTDLDGHLWLYDGKFGIGCYRWVWTGNYGGVTNPYKINGQFAHEVYKASGNTSTSAP